MMMVLSVPCSYLHRQAGHAVCHLPTSGTVRSYAVQSLDNIRLAVFSRRWVVSGSQREAKLRISDV